MYSLAHFIKMINIINNVYLVKWCLLCTVGVYFAFYFKDRYLRTEPTLPPPIASMICMIFIECLI